MYCDVQNQSRNSIISCNFDNTALTAQFVYALDVGTSLAANITLLLTCQKPY